MQSDMKSCLVRKCQRKCPSSPRITVSPMVSHANQFELPQPLRANISLSCSVVLLSFSDISDYLKTSRDHVSPLRHLKRCLATDSCTVPEPQRGFPNHGFIPSCLTSLTSPMLGEYGMRILHLIEMIIKYY